MITIIAGSRDLTGIYKVIRAVRECGWPVTEIISGHARGIDTDGERYAVSRSIPLRIFRANWQRWGYAAGHKRNAEMISKGKAQALIAIWDGQSKGTAHMIKIAREAGLRVFVQCYSLEDEEL